VHILHCSDFVHKDVLTTAEKLKALPHSEFKNVFFQKLNPGSFGVLLDL